MTMHLVQGMSTLNTKKRKKKLTQKKIDQMQVEWRQYNKRMRQSGCHSAQFEEFEDYIAYVMGTYKPKKNAKSEETYTPKKSEYYRKTEHIPSRGDGIGNGFAKERNQYTGDLIVGIGTMHKSNAVPIMRGTKQAEELAKMRR